MSVLLVFFPTYTLVSSWDNRSSSNSSNKFSIFMDSYNLFLQSNFGTDLHIDSPPHLLYNVYFVSSLDCCSSSNSSNNFPFSGACTFFSFSPISVQTRIMTLPLVYFSAYTLYPFWTLVVVLLIIRTFQLSCTRTIFSFSAIPIQTRIMTHLLMYYPSYTRYPFWTLVLIFILRRIFR